MSLPSFLSPLARVAVGTLPPLGGAPTALMFTMETQQQSNWCWAAAATSIFKFYSNSNQWSQCSVAGSCLRPELLHKSRTMQSTILFRFCAKRNRKPSDNDHQQ